MRPWLSAMQIDHTKGPIPELPYETQTYRELIAYVCSSGATSVQLPTTLIMAYQLTM